VAIDRIGVYLDDGTVTAPGDLVANGIPQIQSDSGVYLTDTISWMKLSGSFISNGTEEYLTVGNFYDNAHTNYIERPSSPQNGYLVACYLIDDISVIPSDLPAYAGRDTIVGLGDSVFIGREPEIGLECTWYDLSGQVIGQGAGMWVTPTHITSYIVEQTLCGNITRDTVTIWALGTDIDIAEKEQVRIYPNPSQNHFHVSVPFAANSVKLNVWDMVGRQLFTQTWTSPSEIDTDIPTPNWAKGLYLFKIEIDGNTTKVGRLVKE
jgi:hypothetical protein